MKVYKGVDTMSLDSPVKTTREKGSRLKLFLGIAVAAVLFAALTMPKDLPAIPQEAIDRTIEDIKADSLVRDAAVIVDKGRVILSVVVNRATSADYGKRLGDRFARRLASNASFWSDDERLKGVPTLEHLGPLWDHYDLQVIVSFDPDNVLVQGAKVRTARGITW